MRQFVVATSDGRLFGLVLDVSPMTDAEAALHVRSFGARTPGDLTAWARYLAGSRNGWTLCEVVGRDRSFSAGGRARRRYPASSHCRVVASHPIAYAADAA